MSCSPTMSLLAVTVRRSWRSGRPNAALKSLSGEFAKLSSAVFDLSAPEKWEAAIGLAATGRRSDAKTHGETAAGAEFLALRTTRRWPSSPVGRSE